MEVKQNNYLQRTLLTILWLIVGVFGRLLPHVPNLTPMNSLSLFAGSQLKKRYALPLVLSIMFIADIALAYSQGHPVVSAWTLFTYSGFVLIALFGTKLTNNPKFTKLSLSLLGTAAFFWIWTNFGVWLTSNIYPKTLQGLIICYTAALPFLRNEILGNLIWGLVIFGGFRAVCWLDDHYRMGQCQIVKIGKEELRIKN